MFAFFILESRRGIFILFQTLFCHPDQPRWTVLYVYLTGSLVTEISWQRLWTATRGNSSCELKQDKTNKVTVRPAKTQISLGIHPVGSVFAVRSMGGQGPKISSCRQQRLGSDWADLCPGWSESSLGAQVSLLVLLFSGSYYSSCWHLTKWVPLRTVFLPNFMGVGGACMFL